MIAVVGAMAVVLGSGIANAETPYEAMIDGADYVISWQFTATTVPGHPEYSGGWGWRENYTAPTTNTTGATGQGMLRAYDLTGDADYLDSAVAGANYQMAITYPGTTNSRFATFDPYFMWELSQLASDNTWSNHAATNFYGALAAGTYGPAGDWDTAEYIAAVQANRPVAGANVNLRPWEFSTLAYTATEIGQTGQAALFEAAILDGLNTLDEAKGSDFLGVAGALRGLALMGTESFTAINSPLHSGIDGIDTLAELADYLVSQQDSAGHWWYSSVDQLPDADEDTQTSAYAILGLMAMDEEAYADSIQAGRDFLVGMQLDSGGFWSYPGQTSSWNIEVAGEAVAALPEPATMGFLALGGVAALLRRVRRR
jgi:hypothetical protein